MRVRISSFTLTPKPCSPTYCRRILAALAMALPLLVGPNVASAQSDDRARARAAFGEGVKAYEAGQYPRALESFQEAYRLQPHPSVRVNMANCYERMGRAPEALSHFEGFLAEVGAGAPRAQRNEVRRAIERIRKQTGEVFVRVTPSGAAITIDGQSTKTAPVLDAVRLNRGSHEFVVTKAGYEPVRRMVEVEGGGRAELRVDLVAIEPAPLTPIDASPADGTAPAASETGGDSSKTGALGRADSGHDDSGREPRPGSRNKAAYIALGLTSAAALVAIGTGIGALVTNRRFDDSVARSNDPRLSTTERTDARNDGLSQSDRARRLALSADVLGAAALAGIGVTLYLFLARPKKTSSDSAKLTVQPTVGRHAAGAHVAHSF